MIEFTIVNRLVDRFYRSVRRKREKFCHTQDYVTMTKQCSLLKEKVTQYNVSIVTRCNLRSKKWATIPNNFPSKVKLTLATPFPLRVPVEWSSCVDLSSVLGKKKKRIYFDMVKRCTLLVCRKLFRCQTVVTCLSGHNTLCRLATLSTDTVISVDSLPSPRIQEVGSYTFDRDAELWLGTTAPSASSLLCESKEPLIFKASFSLAFSFLFFFSSSISVKFSASARLSTAMAKKTFKRMSNKCQGISQAITKQKRCF